MIVREDELTHTAPVTLKTASRFKDAEANVYAYNTKDLDDIDIMDQQQNIQKLHLSSQMF